MYQLSKFLLGAVCLIGLWGCSSTMSSQSVSQNSGQPMKRISPEMAAKMRENTRNSMSAPMQTMDEPAPFRGIVAAHNYWRARVNVPALTWSPMLANVAQQWANQLQSRGCPMRHSNTNNYGENLAFFSNMDASPQMVVDMWADERLDYYHNSNTCRAGKQCGHYTQMVWRETTQIGCGIAACGNKQVWVCNYAPAGNYRGQSPY